MFWRDTGNVNYVVRGRARIGDQCQLEAILTPLESFAILGDSVCREETNGIVDLLFHVPVRLGFPPLFFVLACHLENDWTMRRLSLSS